MKMKKNSLMRMETLINNDRMKNSDSFLELLTEDVDKVLKEYFDYKNCPIVDVVKSGKGFSVNISLNAQSIRTFFRLPIET